MAHSSCPLSPATGQDDLEQQQERCSWQAFSFPSAFHPPEQSPRPAWQRPSMQPSCAPTATSPVTSVITAAPYSSFTPWKTQHVSVVLARKSQTTLWF